jgi:hypothetical protein
MRVCLTTKQGFVADVADFWHLISIFSLFPTPVGKFGFSQGGYAFINTWPKHGQNRVSISRDRQGCTQKYEVELRSASAARRSLWCK